MGHFKNSGSAAGGSFDQPRPFRAGLLHFEHQLGAGEGNAHTFDFFGLDSARSVFIANAARFGHQVDGDVVVDPDDDPRRAVVVAQFAEGMVGEDFQRA